MQFTPEYEHVDNISYIEALQVKINIKEITSEARASYVFGGGTIVFGGAFVCFAQYPDVAPLFSSFDLEWEARSYTRKCTGENELVESNAFLPDEMSLHVCFWNRLCLHCY